MDNLGLKFFQDLHAKVSQYQGQLDQKEVSLETATKVWNQLAKVEQESHLHVYSWNEGERSVKEIKFDEPHNNGLVDEKQSKMLVRFLNDFVNPEEGDNIVFLGEREKLDGTTEKILQFSGKKGLDAHAFLNAEGVSEEDKNVGDWTFKAYGGKSEQASGPLNRDGVLGAVHAALDSVGDAFKVSEKGAEEKRVGFIKDRKKFLMARDIGREIDETGTTTRTLSPRQAPAQPLEQASQQTSQDPIGTGEAVSKELKEEGEDKKVADSRRDVSRRSRGKKTKISEDKAEKTTKAEAGKSVKDALATRSTAAQRKKAERQKVGKDKLAEAVEDDVNKRERILTAAEEGKEKVDTTTDEAIKKTHGLENQFESLQNDETPEDINLGT